MTDSCEHCGTNNRTGAKFCIGCAARLPGFAPTGPSALQLLRGRERAAEAAGVQRSASGPDRGGAPAAVWLRRLVAGGLLLMGAFIAWYLHVVRQAPASDAGLTRTAVIQQQPAFVQLAPFEPDANALPGVSDAARAAAARTASAPVDLPVAAVVPPSATAMDTVAQFYRALSTGDGASAAALVVASKRAQGPLSGEAMSAFYRSLKEPLTLRSVRQVDAQVVEARYTYRATRSVCEGRALVTLAATERAAVIRSIKANC